MIVLDSTRFKTIMGADTCGLSSGAEVAFLGARSPSTLVRTFKSDGCAECFVHMLNESLPWQQTFDTTEELHQALLAFENIDSTTWLIGCLGHRTSAGVRRDLLSPVALAALDQGVSRFRAGTRTAPS